MKQWENFVLSFIWGPLLAAQLVLVLFFGRINENGLPVVMYIGWGVWLISAVLGCVPIIVLKAKGGVPKGKGYVHTTELVRSGLYSIVRHPQYTAGILLSVALILISQTWLIAAMGVVVIPLSYVDILKADKHEVAKFGEAYERYMKDVPRTNFVWGIIRRLRRRGGAGG